MYPFSHVHHGRTLDTRVYANENIPRHLPPGPTLLPTVDHVYVARQAMRSLPNLAFSDHSDRFVRFDRRLPITFSEALDEQAHAEPSFELNWCWVSVSVALVFPKLSDFKLVFGAPDYRGMSVFRYFSSFVPLFEVWEEFF